MSVRALLSDCDTPRKVAVDRVSITRKFMSPLMPSNLVLTLSNAMRRLRGCCHYGISPFCRYFF
ncbi:conserved hypothetical protein [delta proteobacterium NaphS2]|nr:conserved hypothetical protein [delta proteobacterium NaphS2]